MARVGRKPAGDLSDPEVVDELCARLIGGEGVTSICADAHMPSKTAVYEHMAADEEFRTRIARAREAQQEALIDETVEMADNATAADWQVVKLRIWARQWRAAKLAPKRYGDSVQLRHADADGETIQISDPAAAARLAALLETVRRRKEQQDAAAGEGALLIGSGPTTGTEPGS